MRVFIDVMQRLTSNYDNEKNVTFMRSLRANIFKSNNNVKLFYFFNALVNDKKNLGWGDNIKEFMSLKCSTHVKTLTTR